MIDMFDHFTLIFLYRPIPMIKTIIICKRWLINCRLPISNVIWAQICRKRPCIWIMKPWWTRIRHTEISTPWYIDMWSIWWKRRWCRKTIPLPILMMNLMFWNFLEISSLTSMFHILLFEDLAESFLFGFNFFFSCLWRLLASTVFQTPISGFLGSTILSFDLILETLGEGQLDRFANRSDRLRHNQYRCFCFVAPRASKYWI